MNLLRAANGALILTMLAGCQSGEPTVPDEEVTQTEMTQLLVLEPESVAEDYRGASVTFRLFGTQAGDETPFATLADTRSWQTRDVRPGDLIGRNLRVTAIGESFIELGGRGPSRRVEVGRDVTVRVVRHRVDEAVRYQGRHRFEADASSMQLTRARYGLGATGAFSSHVGHDGVELSEVDPSGLLGKLGLQKGDLIATREGAQVTEANFAELEEALTQPGTVSLTVVRGHSVMSYSVEVK